jgi:esterase/lipase superfamily enzyme
MVSIRKLAAIFVCVALLGGCAGGQSHNMLNATTAEPQAIAGTHRILVATTRERSQQAGEVFSGARGDGLSFARVDVTVPGVHVSGRLEEPSNGARRDAAKHFAAGEIAVFPDPDGFVAAARKSLVDTQGRALVFIHGYRTPFDGSAYRAAQIIHDSGYKGTPVLFSWASTGRTVDYIYDNNSATIARDGLEQTLRLLRQAGAKRIDIVAHSMGNWLTMEALRQIVIANDRMITDSLGDVVLASPDIDVDVFKSQLQRIGKRDRPFFVLVSRDDRALLLSSIIAGNRPRVGDYDKDSDIAALGVVVIDVSALSSGDRLNHARFADNPVLVQLLGDRLNQGDDFGESGDQITRRIEQLTRGIGQTLGSAAEIIITTPLEVINIAVGQ